VPSEAYLLKVKTLPFDGTTDATDLSDQQDEIGPEIRTIREIRGLERFRFQFEYRAL